MQLPLSIYDQRLIQNLTISRLKYEGYTIYARSIYLQGLILKVVTNGLIGLIKRLLSIMKILKNLPIEKKLKLIDLAIEYIKSQNMIEAAIFGICSLKELKELNRSWRKEIILKNHRWEQWNLNDIKVVNPLLWPNKHKH